ncbi:MAG: hypothetical protein ACYDCO_16370 [Armatimonadota bacterium]
MRKRLFRSRPAKILLALLLIAGVAVGWWIFTRPKRFTVVAVLPDEHVPFSEPYPYQYLPCAESTDEGFLTVRQHEFVFRGWDGRERWRITPFSPGVSGEIMRPSRGQLNAWYPGAWSLSPNGHCFAAAVPDGRVIHWKSWRDGKPVTDVRTPVKAHVSINSYFRPTVAIGDEGRIWAGIPRENACMVYAIDGNHITASGEYAYRFSTLPVASCSVRFVPVAGVAALCSGMEFVVLDLNIQGRALKFTKRFTGQEHLQNAYPREKLLATVQAWFRLSDGKRVPFPQLGTNQVTASGAPDHWTVAEPESASLLLNTMDGRFALVHNYSTRPSPLREKIFSLIGRIPGVARTDFYQRQFQVPSCLEVYERPGRLRASLPVVGGTPAVAGKDVNPGFDISLPPRVFRVSLQKVTVSPDGHFFTMELHKPGEGTVLLRW